MNPALVLMMLPDRDFDPTESSTPWCLLDAAGHVVTFATESGEAGVCDL